MSSRNGRPSAQENFQQQRFDQGFDQAALGDAAEALGRVRTGEGGGSPGAGVRGGAAVPINFKELVVLARRGTFLTEANFRIPVCALCETYAFVWYILLFIVRSTSYECP